MVGRRRQFNAEGGRGVRREVKVTAEQDVALRVRAEAAGVSVPRLLVESALAEGAPETAADRRELLATLFRLQNGLSAVGNNLNQLTRAANATGEIEGNLSDALTMLRRVVHRIDDALDALSLEEVQR